MKRLLALILLCSVSTDAWAQAQDVTVETKPGVEVRLGLYPSVRPDCAPGDFPAVAIHKAPAQGLIIIRSGTTRIEPPQPCAGQTVPAQAIFYQPAPTFSGEDLFEVEVATQGRNFRQAIKILIR